MAITSRDQLVTAIAAGPTIQFNKPSITTVAGFYYTFFRSPGMPGTAGSAPASTGVQLTRTSTGAIPIPAPSNTSYFSSIEAVSSNSGTLILSDRLVEFGGLSTVTTTAQTVSALALPTRASSATDVELWIDVYTAGGATSSVSVAASYTNQSGTAGQTASLTVAASGWPVNRSYQMTLQAGDTGVQSVQSITVNTSSGTAGSVGPVLRRTLLTCPVPAASIGIVQGWSETDLTICPDSACLELIYLAAQTSSGNVLGNIGIAQG